MLQNILDGALLWRPPVADWKIGHIQSVFGVGITVKTVNAEKHLIDGDVVDRVTIRDNKFNG